MRVRWINGLWCQTARCFWQISISIRHIKQQTVGRTGLSLSFSLSLSPALHLPTSSFLCCPWCIFCRPPPFTNASSPSFPSLLLSFHPLVPFSFSFPPSLSLSSFTGVARSDGGLDHCGNLWEKVVRSLAQLRRERGSERLRKTLGGLCVCLCERERARGRKKSCLFWAAWCSVAHPSCKEAEGSSLGFWSRRC